MSINKDYEDHSTNSFSDDASWNSGNTSGDEGNETMVKDDSRSMSFLKLITIASLLLATAAMSCSTYFLLRKREAEEFESAFDEQSTEILNAVEARIQRQATAAEFFAATISSYAESSGQVWPFVSLPDLDISSLNLASAISIIFSPLVSETEVAAWENFTGRIIPGNLLRDRMHTGSYMPLYQASPHNYSFRSYDLLDQPGISRGLERMLRTQASLITDLDVGDSGYLRALPLAIEDPIVCSMLLQPVFSNSRLVGAISLLFDWTEHLQKILYHEERGPLCAVVSTCNTSLSFLLNGHEISFLGQGDYHDTKFGNSSLGATIALNGEECPYNINVWPTPRFRNSFATKFPVVATCIVSLIFLFAIFLFCSYDKFVSRKQKALLNIAKKSNAIITSLFPVGVRDRLMEEAKEGDLKHSLPGQPVESLAELNPSNNAFQRKPSSFSKFQDDLAMSHHKPKVIADRYPYCTIIFCDLVGFTAWSSQRSPELVFCLLESIFGSFDKAARRRGIYKVETIGDCYLAVTGLPSPQEDHAKRMAKFALDCLVLLSRVTRKLSKTMGYDTVDLKARIGLHSGPVTAGVLRGERGRFQLFGDTVNTASRMESTGEPGKIQISHTVEPFLRTERAFRILPRGLVAAKGKGTLQTFWLMPGRLKSISTSFSSRSLVSEEEEDPTPLLPMVKDANRTRQYGKHVMAEMQKTARLLDWVVELLVSVLKEVVAYRGDQDLQEIQDQSALTESRTEVAELIEFPESRASCKQADLSMEVLLQLREFVTKISFMYRDGNPFHNFEHAGKVLLSMARFLSASRLSLDPLTKFACLFSALIHDLDHSGKTNQQLIDEGALIAEVYTSSIAEQNSLDLALSLLMEEHFSDLRACIFPTAPELKFFRQVTTNLVLATDISGQFGKPEETEIEELTIIKEKNRALELLIQASDVAHAMQHFDVYCKWNYLLFSEMNEAYQSGKTKARAPSDFWYKGELSFFDNYVLPLAKQLKQSGFFGHLADECLNYALSNRAEWEERGAEIVAGFTEKKSVK